MNCFTLCGMLLRVLLRNVMSHDAATDRANDCVVARVVPGYTTDDCALEAAGGICGSGRRQSQGGSRDERTDSVIQSHDSHLHGFTR